MDASLVDLLLASAGRDPGKVALRRRQATWTYGDVVRGAAAAAARLRAAGLEPGDRVALLFRNCPEYVALFYGALAARLSVAPLNVQERASVLAVQVAHSGARVVLGDPDHPEWAALRAALPADVAMLDVTAVDDDASVANFMQAVGAAPGQVLTSPAVARDDMAVLLYTSGTTGRPKGVMLSHGNLVANNVTIIDYLKLGPGDVGLTVMPFHFSYGNSVLHTHLGAGATLLLEDNLAYPLVVMQRLQNERVTGFSGVPSTFAILMSRTRIEDFDLSSMRYLTQAGGAMTRAAIQRMRQLVPSARFFVMYGQTEATARLTYLPPERLDEKLGSIGKALAGIDIEVRGPQGEVLPPGQTGELCARGPNIMLGYWRDEEATRRLAAHRRPRAHRRGRVPLHRRSSGRDDQGRLVPGESARDRGGAGHAARHRRDGRGLDARRVARPGRQGGAGTARRRDARRAPGEGALSRPARHLQGTESRRVRPRTAADLIWKNSTLQALVEDS